MTMMSTAVLATLAATGRPPCPICGAEQGHPCRTVPKIERDFPGRALGTAVRYIRHPHAGRPGAGDVDRG